MKKVFRIFKRSKRYKSTLFLKNFLWASVLLGSFVACFLLYKNRSISIIDDENNNEGLNNFDTLHEIGLRDQALETWNQFKNNFEEEGFDFKDISLLEGALEKLQRFKYANIGYSGKELEIIKKMQQLVNEFYAESIALKIKELEETIDFDEKNNNFSSAIKNAEEALNLQIKINQDYPNSKDLNYVKVSSLESRILKLKVLPLFLKSQSLENKGNKYIKDFQWKKALKAMQQAKELQIVINQDYPQSMFFRYNRVNVLDKTIQKILSSDEYIEIKSILRQANLLDSGKNYKESAKLFAELRDRQKKINEDFPLSPYVSSSKVLFYEQYRQTAESRKLYQRISKNKVLVDTLLLLSEFDQAINLSITIFQQIEQFLETYPESKLDINPILEQVQYIKEKRDHLLGVRDWFDKNLQALDKNGSIMIAKSEVPQFIYEIIMDENPSRQVGNQNPVESVTWFEANTFCKNLSLLTGQRVQLPKVKEYKNIISKNQPKDLTNIAWYNKNSNGVTQKIATLAPVSGLYDLWGNVSEWLLKDNFEIDADLSKHAYFSSSVANERQKPDSSRIIEGSGYERIRTRGFRFVVYKKILQKK